MLGALTLDQLRVLAAVAETGGFSAAGRRLGRVQSAISQQIQGLEASLGLTLFDRARKAPALTDAGRALLAQARQVLAEADALRSQARAMAAGMEPSLTLAIDNLFPSPPLLAALKDLREAFPDLALTLHTAPILAAERRLREGGADIALCGLSRADAVDLVSLPLTRIDMIPTAAAGHALAAIGRPLTREELGRHTQLILTDPAAGPEVPSFGVVSARVWRFVDLGRRLDFLRAGLGWANMPAHLVAPLIAAGELARLELAEQGLLLARIPIHAIHIRDRPPGPAGRWFLDRLLAACGAAAAG